MRSIYDAAAALEYSAPNPESIQLRCLDDLTGDYDKDPLALRNLRKILNHLDLLRMYDCAIRRLGLHPEGSSPELYRENGLVLADHRARRIATAEAIAQIAHNGRPYRLGLTPESVTEALRTLFPIAHCELHPTDACNLRCSGCTYLMDIKPSGERLPSLPSIGLERLAALKPRSILISGGGEPLIYRQGTAGLPDLVNRLHHLLPSCRFALVSNGTLLANGEWLRNLDWVRFSVDAATSETYQRCRGRDAFAEVAGNIIRFLRETTVPHVGVGFVYSSENISEAANIAEYFYKRIQSECSEHLHRFNIQYRPLRADLEDRDRRMPGQISDEQIRLAEADFLALARKSPDMRNLLRNHTNCEVIQGGNRQIGFDFRACLYSLIFQIIRPNGDLMPCFVRVKDRSYIIGNLFRDSPESIVLNRIESAMYLRPGCSADSCRQSHLNWIVAKALAGEANPSLSPAVTRSPFF